MRVPRCEHTQVRNFTGAVSVCYRIIVHIGIHTSIFSTERPISWLQFLDGVGGFVGQMGLTAASGSYRLPYPMLSHVLNHHAALGNAWFAATFTRRLEACKCKVVRPNSKKLNQFNGEAPHEMPIRAERLEIQSQKQKKKKNEKNHFKAKRVIC